MRIKAILPLYFTVLFALPIGFIFRVQHWPFGSDLITLTLLLGILWALLVIKEIISSKNATVIPKTIWTIGGCLFIVLDILLWLQLMRIVAVTMQGTLFLFFISGPVYLIFGRKIFAPKEKITDKIKFDSI